jgi:PTS system nitrogen regulatory IIA component
VVEAMKLSEIFTEAHIIPELKAKNKQTVLEELVDALSKREPSLDKGTLVRVLIERERLGSTGIGEGVAIPHGKIGGINQPIISFGRSRQGLDFDSVDGQKAHLFFLLIAPENSAGIHLKVLARIAKILKSSVFRKRLMEAKGSGDIYRTIVETDEESSET